MKQLLRRVYSLPVFIGFGLPIFAMARSGVLEPLVRLEARILARLVLWAHGPRRCDTPAAMADEWNRLMPRPRSRFPVVGSEGNTAFAEIRVRCPLRGSGNAEACWRAMEFDRELLRELGGKLVVIESQSTSGHDYCRLAIRNESADVSDLEAAHPRWLTR